jgi:cytochrome c-type biogenesis protein CcmF
MANPDARHYWDHDIFTYISALPNPEKNKDTATFRHSTVKAGDSIFYSRGYMILEKLTTKDHVPQPGFLPGDKATVATVKVHSLNGSSYTAEPLFLSKNGNPITVPDTVVAESLILRIGSTDGETAAIGVKESNSVLQYVTLKAYKFPFIRILWLGIIMTATGIIISMVRRIRLNREAKNKLNLLPADGKKFSKQRPA